MSGSRPWDPDEDEVNNLLAQVQEESIIKLREGGYLSAKPVSGSLLDAHPPAFVAPRDTSHLDTDIATRLARLRSPGGGSGQSNHANDSRPVDRTSDPAGEGEADDLMARLQALKAFSSNPGKIPTSTTSTSSATAAAGAAPSPSPPPPTTTTTTISTAAPVPRTSAAMASVAQASSSSSSSSLTPAPAQSLPLFLGTVSTRAAGTPTSGPADADLDRRRALTPGFNSGPGPKRSPDEPLSSVGAAPLFEGLEGMGPDDLRQVLHSMTGEQGVREGRGSGKGMAASEDEDDDVAVAGPGNMRAELASVKRELEAVRRKQREEGLGKQRVEKTPTKEELDEVVAWALATADEDVGDQERGPRTGGRMVDDDADERGGGKDSDVSDESSGDEGGRPKKRGIIASLFNRRR